MQVTSPLPRPPQPPPLRQVSSGGTHATRAGEAIGRHLGMLIVRIWNAVMLGVLIGIVWAVARTVAGVLG